MFKRQQSLQQPLQPVLSDDEIADLQARNAMRAHEAKELMGKKFLLHTSNLVKRLPKSKRSMVLG